MEPGPVELSVPLSVVKAELFKAMASPARVRVLELLADGERSVGEMQPFVGLEQSHLGQQLGVLRRAGLVVSRKEGSQVFYAVKNELVVELLARGQATAAQLAGRDQRDAGRPERRTGIGVTAGGAASTGGQGAGRRTVAPPAPHARSRTVARLAPRPPRLRGPA